MALRDLYHAKAKKQKTITIHFTEAQRWNEETIESLAADLNIARYAANMPSNGKILVNLDAIGPTPSTRFKFKSALLKGAAVFGAISLTETLDLNQHLPLQVAQLDGSILVSCGKLTSVKVPIGDADDDLYSAILYGICIVCFDLGCIRQAQDAARSVLRHRIKATDSWAAFRAAGALQASPSEMVDFALLNGLEDPALVENSLVTMMLVDTSRSTTSRNWLQNWFEIVENFALKHDMVEPAAATNYNRGNAALQNADFSKAVRYYNRARKLRPEYLTTDYFLQELGGALYNARHYVPASFLYAEAISEESDPIEWHRLGDAQLLSGHIQAAITSFAKAAAVQSASPEMFSCSIKISLCYWMLKTYGEALHARRHAASLMLKEIESFRAQNENNYRRVLQQACALDPVSNFNVGVSCASRSQLSDALHHFVLCGIQCPNDHEAWSNALICSWHIGPEEFFTVLSASYHHNALESYAYFRRHIAAQGMPDHLIEMLDAVVGELDSPTTVSKNFLDWVQLLQ